MSFQVGDRIRALESFDTFLYDIYGFWEWVHVIQGNEYRVSFINNEDQSIYLTEDAGPGVQILSSDEYKFEII